MRDQIPTEPTKRFTAPPARSVPAPRVETPVVVQGDDGPIVFGPGLDDFNQYDDPC